MDSNIALRCDNCGKRLPGVDAICKACAGGLSTNRTQTYRTHKDYTAKAKVPGMFIASFMAILGGIVCAVLTAFVAMLIACPPGSSSYCGMGGALVAIIGSIVSFPLGMAVVAALSRKTVPKHAKTGNPINSDYSWGWILFWFLLIIFIVPSFILSFLK